MAVPGRVHRNGRAAVSRVSGGRRVGSLRLSEPRGVRTTVPSRRLSEKCRDGVENRENV